MTSLIKNLIQETLDLRRTHKPHTRVKPLMSDDLLLKQGYDLRVSWEQNKRPRMVEGWKVDLA